MHLILYSICIIFNFDSNIFTSSNASAVRRGCYHIYRVCVYETCQEKVDDWTLRWNFGINVWTAGNDGCESKEWSLAAGQWTADRLLNVAAVESIETKRRKQVIRKFKSVNLSERTTNSRVIDFGTAQDENLVIQCPKLTMRHICATYFRHRWVVEKKETFPIHQNLRLKIGESFRSYICIFI